MNKSKLLAFLPTVAIILFIILYIIAAAFYPGGSYHSPDTKSFSWTHNYWCNLMDQYAINGEKNVSRNIAISGTAVLCAGLGYFYYLFPKYFMIRKVWRYIIQVVGIASMIFIVFLFTPYHDTVLNIAGVFGFIALIGTLIALRRINSFRILLFGIIAVILIAVNTYIYYTHVYIEYLPLIQKVTMLVALPWLITVNLTFYSDANK